MTTRGKIFAAAFGVLIVIGIASWMSRSLESRYQKKPISVWLDDWAANKNTNYRGAVRLIGTNCIPWVVRNLSRRDSRWRKVYAEFRSGIPLSCQRFFPQPVYPLRTVDGANIFACLGSNSIPCAIDLLNHRSPTVREAAAWGLGALRVQSAAATRAIPALTVALKDEVQGVRFQAVLALMNMGADASNAVPALRVILTDGLASPTNSSFYLQAAAARALGKIGPPARSALPDLEAALVPNVSLRDPPGVRFVGSSYLRGTAAVAVWRIAGDVDTALPVMLREMPGTSDHSKWDWIIALGEMGPAAKAAIPQLNNELQADQQKWVLEYVTNALRRIEGTVPTNTVAE